MFGAAVRFKDVQRALARHLGLWTLSACRIVYVLDEPRRFGFAYGTLEHVVRGEQDFVPEQRQLPVRMPRSGNQPPPVEVVAVVDEGAVPS